MARKFFVGGNWKCNGTKESVSALVKALSAAKLPSADKVDVVVAPTFLHLSQALSSLPSRVEVSAQNCWIKGGGAFTGEISAEQIVDLGAKWVILGHSERRHIMGESDATVADKVAYALSKGLGVIFCIGEQLSEREANHTMDVCTRQMAALASKISDWSRIVVAYEPVWAIGTGKVATPDQAQEVHGLCRRWVAQHVSPAVAETTRIIYGGSVTAGNCRDLAAQPDIDGFLVGGASLKPEFVDIVASAELKS
uniref:Triose phosphate isomerase n=1 Tax=Helicosporidium sp. subsp. Simulium jonesii TaxID=145475 RepID=Q5YBB3_HELSJ|nr:triose phosphate isomerase [Helicosporidium sp. ex Simulium jonesi]